MASAEDQHLHDCCDSKQAKLAQVGHRFTRREARGSHREIRSKGDSHGEQSEPGSFFAIWHLVPPSNTFVNVKNYEHDVNNY
jgi:hypothetical protein